MYYLIFISYFFSFSFGLSEPTKILEDNQDFSPDSILNIEIQKADSLSEDIDSKIYIDDYINTNIEISAAVKYINLLDSLVTFYEKNDLYTFYYDQCIHNLFVLNSYSSKEEEALFFLKKRISFNKIQLDSIALSQSYINVSRFYYEQNLDSLSTAYADSAFQCALAHNHKEQIVESAQNSFWVYEKRNIGLAKFYLDIALKYAEINKSHDIYLDLLYDLAWWNKNSGLDKEGIHYLKKAIEYKIKNNIEYNLEFHLIDLVDFYMYRSMYSEAKIYLDLLEKEYRLMNIDSMDNEILERYFNILDWQFTVYENLFLNVNEINNKIKSLSDIVSNRIKGSQNDYELYQLHKFLLFINITLYNQSIEINDEENQKIYCNKSIFYIYESLDKLESWYLSLNNNTNYVDYFSKKAQLYKILTFFITNEIDFLSKDEIKRKTIVQIESIIEELIIRNDNLLNYEIHELYGMLSNLYTNKENDNLKSINMLKNALKYVQDDEVNTMSLYKNISAGYYWMNDFNNAKKFNNLAINYARKIGSKQLGELLYEQGEIYINLNQFEKAISSLIESQNIFRENSELFDLNQKRKLVNNDPRITQLLSYCYHKLRLPELLLANSDYYKSYINKDKLGINADIKSKFLNIQKNLKFNEAIIAYINMNTKNTYESTGIKMINNPIILYIDKSQIKSRFMFDKNSVINHSEEFLTAFHDNENQFIDSLSYNNLNIRENLKTFYSNYIMPIEDLLETEVWDDSKNQYTKVTDITIIPDSYLYKLPFGAFIDKDDKYLIENYNISYSNSFSLLLDNKNNNIINTEKVLAIGDPIYKQNEVQKLTDSEIHRGILLKDSLNISLEEEFYNLGYNNFESLPGTKKELDIISKIFSNTIILSQENASEEKLKNLSIDLKLGDYSFIHFACHAFYNEKYPHLSSLVLSQNQKNNQDGFLTLKEIENLNLNGSFINLSACQTARGEMYVLEGVDGFVQSFFNAGAQSVLSTLWPIEDNSAQIFMEEYYTNYSFYNDIGKSLSITKQKFLDGEFGDNYKNPIFWSPYIYFYRK